MHDFMAEFLKHSLN